MSSSPAPLTAGALLAGVIGVALAAGCSTSTPTADPPPSTAAASAAGTTPTTVGAPATGRATTASTAGGTSAGTAASERDACELITEADASEAFGEPVQAGDQYTDECWWSTANDLKTVNVKRATGDIDQWRSGYRDNSSWEPVDIGDEGYAGKVFDSIVFRVGETTYEVNVIYSTKGDPAAAVQTLAGKVASRV